MMDLIFILGLNLGFSKVESQSQSFVFEIGHHSSEAFELKVEKGIYSLSRYENSQLTQKNALTKKHFEKIKSDWLKVFSDRTTKQKGSCSLWIYLKVTKSKKSKEDSLCFTDWAPTKQKVYTSFYNKLKDFATGKSTWYQ